jgi:hypothetical protein
MILQKILHPFMKFQFEKLSVFLLSWILFIYTSFVILSFFHFSVSRDLSWMLSLIYICISIYFVKKIRFFIEAACILFGFGLFSFFFFDYSYDGQMYHTEAMYKIANGWNPVYDHFQENQILDIVYNHFAKSAWIFGGYLYSMIGDIKILKIINLIWALITFGFIKEFIIKFKLSVHISYIVAFLVAINPIFLNSYHSTLIDYQISCSICLLFVFFFSYIKWGAKKYLWGMSFLTFYFVNIKITALVYIVIFQIFIGLYFLYQKKYKDLLKIALIFSIVNIFAFSVFGFNTYIKNYLHHGHCFYPLYDRDGKSMVDKNQFVDAIDYRHGNRFMNVIKSHFAKTCIGDCYNGPVYYKVPFSVSKYEIERYAFAGVMIGGFGVWYSGIYILSLLIFVVFYFQKDKYKLGRYKVALFFVIITILFSVYVNPLWYIARYVPQFYILPAIALLIVSDWKKPIFYKAFLGIVLINLFFIMGYSYYNVIVSKTRWAQLASLKEKKGLLLVDFNDHRSNRLLFQKYKINYKEVDTFVNETDLDTFFRSNVVFKEIVIK